LQQVQHNPVAITLLTVPAATLLDVVCRAKATF
jgi:hypothetical protein